MSARYELPDGWLDDLFSHIEADTTNGDRQAVYAWMQAYRLTDSHNQITGHVTGSVIQAGHVAGPINFGSL